MVVSVPIKDIETINQIKSLYLAKGEKADLLLFLLVINTGSNIKKLLDLNIGDIKNRQCLVLDGKKSIALNDEIKSLVMEISGGRGDKEPLFTGIKGNRLDRVAVFYKFKDICRELALKDDINISSWRKTFGYHHYQKYKDLSFLQWYFNQTKVETTMRYIDVEENMNLRYRSGICL